MRRLLAHGYYLGPGAALRRGHILVLGREIAEVLPEQAPLPPADEVMDCSGCLVTPGLVDAHTHLTQSFARGLLDDLPLTEWLEHIWSYELTEEQVYDAALFGAIQALKSGTTCVQEMLTDGPAHRGDVIARALGDIGIRAVVAVAVGDYQEGRNTPVLTTAQALKRTEEFIQKWHGAFGGRLTARASPVGLPACSQALMEGIRDLARSLGVGIHTHACEGRSQTEGARTRFGMGELEALYRWGVLGPETALAHTIWVSDAELDMLAESGASVVHCPTSNMKLTDGVAPVREMLRRGIPVALGTDGSASSCGQDLLVEGRTASLLAKVWSMDAAAYPARQVFDSLTSTGARAVGLSGVIGAIAPGMLADLAVWDVSGPPHLLDETRLLSNFVYSTPSTCCLHVMVDGRFVVRGRRLATLDEEVVLKRCRDHLAKLSSVRPRR